MFCVVYSFQTNPGSEKLFKDAWADLTRIIYKHAGSLGSRLHRCGRDHYIAYAQWPDKASWQNASGRLPESAAEVSERMNAACKDIKTVYELEMVEDLLKNKPSNS
jgi:heme-degrading monooxygenase HmoA